MVWTALRSRLGFAERLAMQPEAAYAAQLSYSAHAVRDEVLESLGRQVQQNPKTASVATNAEPPSRARLRRTYANARAARMPIRQSTRISFAVVELIIGTLPKRP